MSVRELFLNDDNTLVSQRNPLSGVTIRLYIERTMTRLANPTKPIRYCDLAALQPPAVAHASG
jgi:hypothetical protein